MQVPKITLDTEGVTRLVFSHRTTTRETQQMLARFARNPDASVTELREDGTRIVSSKHTPGPWRAVECSDGARHVATRRGNVIAHISAFALDGDRSGNARLIAAAPDLLAACEQALLAATEPVSASDMAIEAHRIRALLRQVIAKATGEERK